jgi:hypothetical protein
MRYIGGRWYVVIWRGFKMTIQSKFDMLESVTILALNCPARVLKIQFDGLLVSYELEYWFEGNIKTVYLYEDELKKGRDLTLSQC